VTASALFLLKTKALDNTQLFWTATGFLIFLFALVLLFWWALRKWLLDGDKRGRH